MTINFAGNHGGLPLRGLAPDNHKGYPYNGSHRRPDCVFQSGKNGKSFFVILNAVKDLISDK